MRGVDILWDDAIISLTRGEKSLLGLWGDVGCVHMALWDREHGVQIITQSCPNGTFPSVGLHHPPAIRLERTIADLYGLTPAGALDDRVWLDHGVWGVEHPLAEAVGTPPTHPRPYTFLPVEGYGLHQIPVGPVHAGIIEPGHFRFTANGEVIVRLEAWLGYMHKGTESLMRGADLTRASALCECVSGDSVVAYAWAFARAVEQALGIQLPAKAHYLRALMAEIERVGNHLGDIGMVCNDAAFAIMLAQCGAWKERALRAADSFFGHRYMRGQVVVGGVRTDLDMRGGAVLALRTWVRGLGEALPILMNFYDDTASLQDRTVTTGVLRPEYAQHFAAGGFVGRGSGRDFDTRRDVSYAPYDQLSFSVPIRGEGDVNARVWIRFLEIQQSLLLITQILDALEGMAGEETCVPIPSNKGGKGFAIVEGFRGDVFVWVRVGNDGRIERCHLRDPSWFQWQLLEVCVNGDIVADFPLCNKSFNCSYSGQDL